MVIGSDDGLSSLFRSCVFSCQQRVLKTLPGPGYHHSKDGIVWLWHFSVNLYIYRSSVYLATAQSQYLMVIGRDGGLSTLCHSCRFACQQRVLKTFSDPVYFHSEDGVVWLWHFLVNLDIYSSPFYILQLNPSTLWWLGGILLWTLCVKVVGFLVSKRC